MEMKTPMRCSECGGSMRKISSCAAFKAFACLECGHTIRKENVHRAKVVETNPEIRDIVKQIREEKE